MSLYPLKEFDPVVLLAVRSGQNVERVNVPEKSICIDCDGVSARRQVGQTRATLPRNRLPDERDRPMMVP